jgi:hypothetical protein
MNFMGFRGSDRAGLGLSAISLLLILWFLKNSRLLACYLASKFFKVMSIFFIKSGSIVIILKRFKLTTLRLRICIWLGCFASLIISRFSCRGRVFRDIWLRSETQSSWLPWLRNRIVIIQWSDVCNNGTLTLFHYLFHVI